LFEAIAADAPNNQEFFDPAKRELRGLNTSETQYEQRMLPCTAFLEGEYGIEGLYMGVPVKLGRGGIEEVVELELSEDEQTMLNESADAVREVVGVLTT